MATKVFRNILSDIGGVIDGFLSRWDEFAQKPANRNVKPEEQQASENASETSDNESDYRSKDQDDDVIDITDHLQKMEREIIAGKEVFGEWTREILSIRAGMYAFANAAASGDYTEDSYKAEGQEENQDEKRKLELINGDEGKEQDKDKQKSKEVDIELSREKDPQKRKAIIKSRSATAEFVKNLDDVQAQRLLAEVEQNSFVMREMLKQELKERGLEPDGEKQKFLKKVAAGGIAM